MLISSLRKFVGPDCKNTCQHTATSSSCKWVDLSKEEDVQSAMRVSQALHPLDHSRTGIGGPHHPSSH